MRLLSQIILQQRLKKNLKLMRKKPLKMKQINLWIIGDFKKIVKMFHLRQKILWAKNNLQHKNKKKEKEKVQKPPRPRMTTKLRR